MLPLAKLVKLLIKPDFKISKALFFVFSKIELITWTGLELLVIALSKLSNKSIIKFIISPNTCTEFFNWSTNNLWMGFFPL